MTRLPSASTLFPYTTLFRSQPAVRDEVAEQADGDVAVPQQHRQADEHGEPGAGVKDSLEAAETRDGRLRNGHVSVGQDRKSTRLNSSHTVISYAVFCLKKKT